MAKGDQEKTMADIGSSRQANEGNYNDYLAGVKQQGSRINPNERGQIWEGATQYASTGGMTPEAADRLRSAGRFVSGDAPSGGSSGSSSGGGYYQGPAAGNPYAMNGGQSAFNSLGPSAYKDVNWNFDESKDVYRQLADKNGGFDPQRLNDIDRTAGELGNQNADRYKDVSNSIENLNKFASTGGLTQQDYNALNRDNFYEFEKTGGYNDKQLADIRARNNTSIPSFYNNLQDQMAQQKLRSGGNTASSFDASTAKIARQSAQQSAEQARNTEIDLAERQRTGKMEASKQLAANEMGVIQALTPARATALSSAAGNANQLASEKTQGLNYGGNLSLNAQDLINKTRLSAAGGIHGIELDDAQVQLAKAKGIDDYTINVATGKDRYATAEDQIAAQERIANAGISASAGASRYSTDRAMDLQQAQLNSLNERYIMGQQQQGQEFGMGQLSDIYRSSSGDTGQFNRDYLAGIQGLGGYDNQNLGLQGQVGTQPGKWATGFNNVLGGIGAAAGGLTGLGGFLPKMNYGGGVTDGASNGWYA